MSRPLRIEYSNAWYHVMNRGRSREDIFYTDNDRLTFLSLLGEIHENFHVQIHAYCLMGNHYHLMLHTPLPNLNRAMRHLGGVYTQRFNRAHNRDGSLFRGRYKSKLVESEEYMTHLSRYIHLNPVDAKMTNLPEDYRWSSYRSYLKKTISPSWLYCDETLAYFGEKNEPVRCKYYQDFVNGGINDEFYSLMEQKVHSSILGSNDFIKKMSHKLKNKDTLEIPSQRDLILVAQPSLTTIQKVIAGYFNISIDELSIPKQRSGNFPRQAAFYLSGKHTEHSHRIIANFFGNTSRYGVTQAHSRLKEERKRDPSLNDTLEKIEQLLQSEINESEIVLMDGCE